MAKWKRGCLQNTYARVRFPLAPQNRGAIFYPEHKCVAKGNSLPRLTDLIGKYFMATNPEYQKPTFAEKTIWWAKVGGIVAALVGAFKNMAELAGTGVAVTVGAFIAEGMIYKHSRTT